MVGIVIVSHSRALGEAVAALAREMAGGSDGPRLVVAAGLDESTFGTDAAAVAAAIEEAASGGQDVLVLVDIGSSVLSAEMACEYVDPDVAKRVRISAAPLVEGLVPAVVSAASGTDLAEVAAEAEEGLDAKRAHLGTAGRVPEVRGGEGVSGPAREASSIDVVIEDPHGLHARPAAKLVALARSYDAQVTVADVDGGAGPVPATSLSKVATLNAGHGARLRVTADGPQAADVLDAVRDLVARNFENSDGGPNSTDEPDIGAAPLAQGSGLDAALGPAHVLRNDVNLQDYQAGSPTEEQQRSERAVAAVADAIRKEQGLDTDSASASPYSSIRPSQAPAYSGHRSTGEVADILGAHLVLLEDDAVLADVADRMTQGSPAPAAWRDVLHALAAEFEALADPYQQARAQDVRAIERQVLRALVQGPESLEGQPVPHGAVLVVDELDPATAAGLDGAGVAGVVAVRGGSTGHGVIVAQSRGIPVYTDGGDAASRVEDGHTVGFDVPVRLLVVDPDEEQRAELAGVIEDRRADAEEAERRATEPAVTGDGRRVRVGANITSPGDAIAAGATGAEGSGLVRTEIVFGKESIAPSVEKQASLLLSIADALHSQPITVRTWDVGGDKPLPFLPGPQEANPMLGVRGLRLMRQEPELFDTQLLAVCQAAEQTPVRVMFPMVATRDEVDWALQRLAEARARTGAPRIPVGIMVEVPAAAIRIGDLATGLDFVSIGTNDLTQYTLAADRGNAGLAELADPLNPAVLQLIRRVVDDVPDGVEVAVCGDLASQVEAVPLLLGLGVHELSVVGPMVPRIKQAIRRTSTQPARRLADRALAASSAQAVRELVAEQR